MIWIGSLYYVLKLSFKYVDYFRDSFTRNQSPICAFEWTIQSFQNEEQGYGLVNNLKLREWELLIGWKSIQWIRILYPYDFFATIGMKGYVCDTWRMSKRKIEIRKLSITNLY